MRFLHLLLIFFLCQNERGLFSYAGSLCDNKTDQQQRGIFHRCRRTGNHCIRQGCRIWKETRGGDRQFKNHQGFEPSDTKEKNFLMNLVEDIDPVYIDITTKIIALFESRLHCKVNVMMNISLSDHIHNAVRNKQRVSRCRWIFLRKSRQCIRGNF